MENQNRPSVEAGTKANITADQLEYKDGDRLYIPVEKIELISKYSAKDGYEPKINFIY